MPEDSQDLRERSGPLQTLIRRGVIQAAALYVAVAWGAVEILLTLQERLGWPDWLARVALALFVAGFPVVLVWSWAKDLKSVALRATIVVLAVLSATAGFVLTFQSGDPSSHRESAGPPVGEAVGTIVVLPFENATGDPAQDYLVAGFTGELTARLSKHPDLAVVQEHSARAPLLAGLGPVSKAERVDADFFVQGTVLREGKFIEVRASLKDLDGRVLWSEILREPYSATGVIAIQRRMSGELSREVGATREAIEFCGETTDVEAMELYYRGRVAAATRRPDGVDEGIELMRLAVEQDPYFGRAWSALGIAQFVKARFVAASPRSPETEQQLSVLQSMALAAFRRALDVCPTIGQAYKVIVPANEEIDVAIDQEMQWRDALAMDPNDAPMLRQYAFHLLQHGMNDQAVTVLSRAYEIEPLLAMIPDAFSIALALAGRCDEALPLAREAVELGGKRRGQIELLCAATANEIDSADELERLIAATGYGEPLGEFGFGAGDLFTAHVQPDSPVRARISERLRQVRDNHPNPDRNTDTYPLVWVATYIEDPEFVLDVLASHAGSSGLYPLLVSRTPIFSGLDAAGRLRGEPRFVEIMDQARYPEYWRAYGWPAHCKPAGEDFACY